MVIIFYNCQSIWFWDSREPKGEQLCKAVTIIIKLYIDTLDAIIKQLGNTQEMLPYITCGPVWDTKTKQHPNFIGPLAYLSYNN